MKNQLNRRVFKGYIVSDSDAVAWLFTKHRVAKDYKDAVRQTVLAGLNIRTTFNPPHNFVNPLRELVKENAISENIINERVKNILYVKFKEGLFDSPYRDEKIVDEVVRCEAHLAIAHQASKESIVLLKNDNNTLPLNKASLKNVLIVGPNANAISSSVSRYGALGVDVISPMRGIKNYLGTDVKVAYALGSELHDKAWPYSEIEEQSINDTEQQLIDEAVTKAKQSDVVIAVMGEDETMVGENLSRSSLDLPGRQKDLLKALKATGKPVILVLVHGRPLSINYSNQNLDAIMATWFPGEFGGDAIAEVLFGDYNPAGRLSTTWPASVGQIPLNFPCKPYSQAEQAKEGPNGTGESRFVDPLYVFGYGLSYAQFEYTNLKINNNATCNDGEISVSFNIKNTGKYDGDEVPQLYVQDVFSTVITYDWQLRGFDRIHLKSGENKTVEMRITPDQLAMINRDMKEVTEPGVFKIQVGSSSTDIRLKGEFVLEY